MRLYLFFGTYFDMLLYLLLRYSYLQQFIGCTSRKLTWREVIPGSIFSTLGWILVSFIFSFYIDNFNNYSRFYGSLGAVFILMTWLFLISMIIILGVEINFVTTEIKNKIHLLDYE